ncbi:MAG: 2-amino-4-hydroxy-6-hydroxymethyldihydropteridine diphosphokinase [Ignavibacterium sp.]|nr:2-amino-4-hydroxy-6-hydroxymethyldihydropteridine diphosphokinase [Ignavibacterium sp.]
MSDKNHIAYIALGSNVGDRINNLRNAVGYLLESNAVDLISSSSVYESLPYGNHNQQKFYNAVIKIRTSLLPLELFYLLKKTELKVGRQLRERWGPREIDLDILFYDDLILANDVLTLPHKGIHLRDFVLLPLVELDRNFIHPSLRISLIELLNRVQDRTIISKIDETLLKQEKEIG